MEFNKATISFDQEFPTMKCDDCEVEFILLGITRHKNEYEEEITRYVDQQSKNVFCPYCGKKE